MQNQFRQQHQSFRQDNYQNSVHKSVANQSTENYINYQQFHKNSLLSDQEVFQKQSSKLNANIQDISKLINIYNRVSPKQYKQEQFPLNQSIQKYSLQSKKGVNYHKQVIENKSKQCIWRNSPSFHLNNVFKNISNQKDTKLNKTTELVFEEDNEPTFRIRYNKDEMIMKKPDKIERKQAQKHISVKEAHLNKIEQDIIEMKKKYQYSIQFYKKDSEQNAQIFCKKQNQIIPFEQEADEALTLQLSQSSESCLFDKKCWNLKRNQIPQINNQQQCLNKRTYKKISNINNSEIKKNNISSLPIKQTKIITKNVQNYSLINPQQRYFQQTKRRDFYNTNIAMKEKQDNEINFNYENFLVKENPPYFKNQSNGFRQIKPEQKVNFSQNKNVSSKSFIQHNKLMINTYQQRSIDKKKQDSPRKYQQLNRSKLSRQKSFKKYLHVQPIEKQMRNTKFSPSKINSNNLRAKKNKLNSQANWIREYNQQNNVQAYFNTFYRKVKDYNIVKSYLNKQQLLKIFMHRILPQNIIDHKWGMTVIDYARLKQRGSLLNF